MIRNQNGRSNRQLKFWLQIEFQDGKLDFQYKIMNSIESTSLMLTDYKF